MSDSRLKSITIEAYLKYVEKKRESDPNADINANTIIEEMLSTEVDTDESLESMLEKANEFSKIEFKRVSHQHACSGMFSRTTKTERHHKHTHNKCCSKTR